MTGADDRRWYAPPMVTGWNGRHLASRRSALGHGVATSCFAIAFAFTAIAGEDSAPFIQVLRWALTAWWLYLAYRFFMHAALYTSSHVASPERAE